MSAAGGFSIEIVPEFLPDELGPAYDGDVDALWRGPLARHVGLHQILYRVAGQMYADYPANILVVLGDLQAEAQAFAEGRSHDVAIAGHPVAYARCKDAMAWFRGPSQEHGGAENHPVVDDGVPLDVIRAAFEAAIVQVRRHIGYLLADGG